ncbi:hypothetical protein NDU88_000850 [Pleurodeles waltl]|uniref:Uncharacterized protein n=1 Tax=Pleurodeles waltl TaxID=8319 RepID=A0AAV7SAU5_PLEWA|nr:hypothetical protein NDU88_000850 [Pleurodeles waltl]
MQVHRGGQASTFSFLRSAVHALLSDVDSREEPSLAHSCPDPSFITRTQERAAEGSAMPWVERCRVGCAQFYKLIARSRQDPPSIQAQGERGASCLVNIYKRYLVAGPPLAAKK